MLIPTLTVENRTNCSPGLWGRPDDFIPNLEPWRCQKNACPFKLPIWKRLAMHCREVRALVSISLNWLNKVFAKIVFLATRWDVLWYSRTLFMHDVDRDGTQSNLRLEIDAFPVVHLTKIPTLVVKSSTGSWAPSRKNDNYINRTMKNNNWSMSLMCFLLNPILLTAEPKEAGQSWQNLSNKSIVGKIFEGEMLIRTLATTLIQIFC